MKKSTQAINRRGFLQTGLLGSAALAAIALPGTATAAVTKAPGDHLHGLKLGMASYTLRRFTLDQAIEMTRQVGLKYINLKDFHLPLKSTPAERAEAHRKVTAAGLTLMGGGVITMNNEADVRAAFEYARDAGMPLVVCSPEPAVLDALEKTAKEFDIRAAIHNHGPGDLKYPSPLDVLKMVQDRDAHLGLCIDVGHTVRLGVDPVDAIEKSAARLYDFHIKDISAPVANVTYLPVGAGVIDIVGVLKALIAIPFTGHVGLEYEANENAPMPGVIESVAYLRGVLAAV